MKSGPALQKLAKHKIEMLQQAVNAAANEADAAQARVTRLDAILEQERLLAAQSPSGVDFARYAAAMKPKRAALAREAANAAMRAEEARAELMEAFAEGKKIEILMERALERERAEEARIEQANLDEMALRKRS
jgi:flagellar export protein FliJ